jgi:hypothetical protein
VLSTSRLLASKLLDHLAYSLARGSPDPLEEFLVADGIVLS